MSATAPTPWFPLYLSLKVALLAAGLALVVGAPLAWLIARRRLPAADLWSVAVTLPMVLPPTVLGYLLLLCIGRQGPLGRWLLERWHVNLVFTWQAAVLAATLAALPLAVRTAQAAFEGVDPLLEAAARTLGRSELAIFFTVAVPLAARGLLAGGVLAFARAMGEFGATLMVAGNIPGRTQTLPLAIYDAVQAGDQGRAAGLVLVSSLGTGLLLWVVQRLSRPRRGDAGR